MCDLGDPKLKNQKVQPKYQLKLLLFHHGQIRDAGEQVQSQEAKAIQVHDLSDQSWCLNGPVSFVQEMFIILTFFQYLKVVSCDKQQNCKYFQIFFTVDFELFTIRDHYNFNFKYLQIYQNLQLNWRLMDIEQPNIQQENERIFSDFITRQDIKNNLDFNFDLDQFRLQHPTVTQDVISNPTRYYKIVRSYLEKNLHNDQKRKFQSKIDHFNISFSGNLGSNFVTPRGLSSRMSNQLVGIHGIVTKMDLVKCQLEKSVHWCEKTKTLDAKQYPDSYAPEKQFEANKTRFIRNYDDNNNPLDFQYGLSSFRNLQHIVVQQLPQMAPPGLLPQSVNVILQGELVNTVKPGDRVEIVGIYKLISGFMSKQKGIFKPYFLCLSIKSLVMSISAVKMTSKMPCPESELFSLFSRSIAPSIYGHQQLKKAVLLMLLGGCEKVLENGTHLRGDINILMVGDPGTAKSQILRWVLTTVDVGVGTTGSGASGVGLTAAIVSQRETGQKTLQAGAMVLADRGVVCIDQFDKMNDIDRVAVHEVMEQQTVTIAKAGIHCSLNARCSVIAAANPIYGQYQKDKAPTKNIGMADSLLSRFDLIFIILDDKTAEKDKRIAERVCRNHRLAPVVNEWSSQFFEDDDFIIQPIQNQKLQENMFQKSHVFKSDSKNEILTQGFLKKYINYCKANVIPILTDDSITLLSALWALLRQRDFNERTTNYGKVLPITIRSYETLIRLSSAHAKLRQSASVQLSDCIQAFRLMAFCLEGSQNALDSDLEQTLKQNGLEVQFMKVNEPKPRQQGNKKNEKNKKEETEDIIKGIQKIQIGKQDKQVDKLLKKSAITIDPPMEMIQKIYRALVTINNKNNQQPFLVSDFKVSIRDKKYTDDQIEVVLEHLSSSGKISISSDGKTISM